MHDWLFLLTTLLQPTIEYAYDDDAGFRCNDHRRAECHADNARVFFSTMMDAL